MYVELREYHVASQRQKSQLIEFLGSQLIPGLNGLGHGPIGAFLPVDETSTLYMTIPGGSLEALATAEMHLAGNPDFTRASDARLYETMTSSLIHGFEETPAMEIPSTDPERVLQLRIYENPSSPAQRKKEEMFHAEEIHIFRKVGLHPVFFGTSLSGPRMPNITYMLGFSNAENQRAAWQTFISDPDWQRLSAIPAYSDDLLIRNITNVNLKPLGISQI